MRWLSSRRCREVDMMLEGKSVIIRITEDVITKAVAEDSSVNDGAELIFHGRVRSMEHGKPIVALEYEHYEGMAQDELEKLGRETLDRFSLSHITCIHRVGEISVGEISLQVIIRSVHRVEGLQAMAWFISELKKHVPIWKHAVFPDGTKIPSPCTHHDPENNPANE